jgi:hypothetical protein
MPGGILVRPQEAHLVRPALKRRHAGIKKGEQEVIWLQAALHLEGDDPLKDLGHIRARAGKRGAPAVALTRSTCVEGG